MTGTGGAPTDSFQAADRGAHDRGWLANVPFFMGGEKCAEGSSVRFRVDSGGICQICHSRIYVFLRNLDNVAGMMRNHGVSLFSPSSAPSLFFRQRSRTAIRSDAARNRIVKNGFSLRSNRETCAI